LTPPKTNWFFGGDGGGRQIAFHLLCVRQIGEKQACFGKRNSAWCYGVRLWSRVSRSGSNGLPKRKGVCDLPGETLANFGGEEQKATKRGRDVAGRWREAKQNRSQTPTTK